MNVSVNEAYQLLYFKGGLPSLIIQLITEVPVGGQGDMRITHPICNLCGGGIIIISVFIKVLLALHSKLEIIESRKYNINLNCKDCSCEVAVIVTLKILKNHD